MSAETVARIRINLMHLKPEVWRRVEVPLSLHLKGLHDVIQAAFGWLDYHLFEFQVGTQRYGIPDADWDYHEVRQARSVRLAALVARSIDRFSYLYDFGDHWEHAVVIEATEAADPKLSYPRFVDGARRCPPEDVGSVSGFFEFLEAVIDPGHVEHQRMIRWYGRIFDPHDIGLTDIQQRLAALAKRRRIGQIAYAKSRLMR
jgi:hypothetical protein